MAGAAREYAEHRASPDAWALGRFVVPAGRLAELEAVARGLLPHEGEPWRLSVLLHGDVPADLGRVGEFDARHAVGAADGRAVADAVELRAGTIAAIEAAADMLPVGLEAYVEVPIVDDPAPLIRTIAGRGLRAKVRTGGTNAEAFPRAADLARFIAACVDAGVPFKATAGLHHPLRGAYRLTYAEDSARGTMFGFLNVFLATAFARAGLPRELLPALLEESSPANIRFDDGAVVWRDHRVTAVQLEDSRREIARAFGSCSFREPVDDLRALRLL
jgi:hypothetical protein